MPKSTHDQRITITDVARRASVSIATVSRVLNRAANTKPETAARVRAAVAELNYIPRAAARQLASQKTNTLGLILPEISDDFFSPLLRGIESVAREEGYALLIYTTRNTPQPAEPSTILFQRPLGEHNTDGLLAFADSLDEEELRRLHALNFPMVLLHRTPPPDLQIPCVTIENKSGVQRMMTHLIEVHKFGRIAFLTGPSGHEDSYWRELGYRESLAAHNIPFDPDLIGYGGFDDEVTRETMRQWLAEGRDFEALFAGDDDSALGAISALRGAGKNVPGDVAVVGFDDVPTSRHLTPPLTTVRAPTEKVGREAVRQLLHLIHHQQPDPLVLLPTELVIRQSCGCSG